MIRQGQRLYRPILIAALLAGCATPERIARYPALSVEQSLAVLKERSSALVDVSAQGLLTLTRPGGQSVRLDVAMALRPPDEARLRAWKFGQAVFDLTVSRDGVWVVQPPRNSNSAAPPVFDAQAADSTRQWLQLLSGRFNSPRMASQFSGSLLMVQWPLGDGWFLTCSIDRATLTPRRYTIASMHGQQSFELLLSRYEQDGNIVWPRRIEAISGTGRILLELGEVTVNGGLPATAFHPPRRASKIVGPATQELR